jgi:myosin-5
VSEEGVAYSWPIAQGRNDGPFLIAIPKNHLVKSITAGNQFAVLISNHGNVFSFGQNQHGELGLGDQEDRLAPTLVKHLRNHKINQIACGFKHVICRSTLGKVFAWGWNEYGQLSSEDFKDQLSPKLLETNNEMALYIGASFRSSIVLTESK